MPLPNYGYYNKEEKKHQDLVFKGAPQIVDMPVEDSYGGPNSRKESRKRGQVTTGTIGIDLERKLVLHAEKDKEIWKPPEIDRQEQEEIKKFASKEHKNLRREVRSTLDSLISGNKVKEIKDNNSNSSASDKSNFSLPALSKSSNAAESPSKPSFTSYGGREITKTGVSIQPKGFYRLDSKKSIGSFNPSSQSDDNSMTQTSSYSFSSSSSSRSTFRY